MQKERGGGVLFLKIARIMLGGLTWVMSNSCLPSLVAAFFWALVGVWSVLELTSDEMLELPLPAKGERGGEGGREREQIWVSTAKYKDLPYQNLAWLQETKLEAADVHFVHTWIGVNYIITYSMCIFTCTKVADNLPCYRDSLCICKNLLWKKSLWLTTLKELSWSVFSFKYS